jgi:hypothetical protein
MARTLGPGSLKIGETGTAREWGGNLTKTALTPTTNSEDDIPLLDGSTETGEDTYEYTLDGTLLDDYDYDSLANFALANKGTELPFVWTPNAYDGGTSYVGTVRISPIAIGGDVKKKNTNDFSFKVIGEPTAEEYEAA